MGDKDMRNPLYSQVLIFVCVEDLVVYRLVVTCLLICPPANVIGVAALKWSRPRLSAWLFVVIRSQEGRYLDASIKLRRR